MSSSDKVERAGEGDGFRPLLGKVKDTRVKLGPGMYGLESGATYDLRVRSHSLAAFSLPSQSLSYTVPGLGMHTALMAGIVGGVAFAFIAFALLGLCIARRATGKLKYSAASNGYGPPSLRLPTTPSRLLHAQECSISGNGKTGMSMDNKDGGFADTPYNGFGNK